MSVQPLVALTKEVGVVWQLTYEGAMFTIDTMRPTTRTAGHDLVAIVNETVKKVRFELDTPDG